MKNYITPFEEFDYEVCDGWLEKCKEITRIVEQYNRNRPEDEQIEIFQIKSKFGELRVYLDFKDGNSVIDVPGVTDRINEIIDECSHTCEWCGSQNNVTTFSHKGWIRTLCEKCKKQCISER